MKRMLIAGIVWAGLTAIAHAWPEGNPDRYPSIGLSYTGIATDGEITYVSGPLSAKQDVESTSGVLMVDTRLPVSRNITLYGGLGAVGAESTAMETSLLDGGKRDEGGIAINLGIRFYIH